MAAAYICRNGPAKGILVISQFPNGFVLTDEAGKANDDGLSWTWSYKKSESWVDTGDTDEEGNTVKEMRGYYWAVDEDQLDGEPFDPQKAEHIVEGPELGIVAYESIFTDE